MCERASEALGLEYDSDQNFLVNPVATNSQGSTMNLCNYDDGVSARIDAGDGKWICHRRLRICLTSFSSLSKLVEKLSHLLDPKSDSSV